MGRRLILDLNVKQIHKSLYHLTLTLENPLEHQLLVVGFFVDFRNRKLRDRFRFGCVEIFDGTPATVDGASTLVGNDERGEEKKEKAETHHHGKGLSFFVQDLKPGFGLEKVVDVTKEKTRTDIYSVQHRAGYFVSSFKSEFGMEKETDRGLIYYIS